jgi:predicted lipoprotein with Yx(FWY)xxD motif
MNKLLLAALATAFTANVALAQSVAENDGVLTSAGRTLYTFDKDEANKSNCNGACATAWPPFMAKDGARASGNFSVITRDDGARQWAINEKPLYFFAADAHAGDAKGDGKGGAWHVVRGASKTSSAEPAAVGGYRSGY